MCVQLVGNVSADLIYRVAFAELEFVSCASNGDVGFVDPLLRAVLGGFGMAGGSWGGIWYLWHVDSVHDRVWLVVVIVAHEFNQLWVEVEIGISLTGEGLGHVDGVVVRDGASRGFIVFGRRGELVLFGKDLAMRCDS